MSYRPFTDVMILTRPKLKGKIKYHGSYPAGFLHRGRELLGVGRDDVVLHVCAGKVRQYPYKGLGANDLTLDLDPACDPDYLRDARLSLPTTLPHRFGDDGQCQHCYLWNHEIEVPRSACSSAPPSNVKAVMIDRPYDEENADEYVPGRAVLPPLRQLLKTGLAAVPVGGKVGILDWEWPSPPSMAAAKEVAVVGVATGRGSRARWYTVWERLI